MPVRPVPFRLLPPAWTGWLLALPPLIFLALLLALPLGRTLAEAGVSWQVWQDPYFQGRLWWTLGQATLTAAIALLIGGPLAYLLSRYDVPAKALLLRVLLLPFVTPTLVAVLGISALLGPQGWLSRPLGLELDGTPTLIIVGNLFFNLPVMIRLCYGSFARVSPNLIGAARTLGAGSWRSALGIALPLALPGIAAGVMLVWLYSALSFGLPLALGGEQYATLEVEIYTLTALQLRLSEASALIAGQLLITLLATALYTLLLRGGVGVAAANLPRARGGAAGLLYGLLTLVLLICFGPLLAVALRGVIGSHGPTLLHWQSVWQDADAPLQLKNTLRFAALAMLGAAALGGLHALGAWLGRSRTLDLLSLLPLMVSPVSLAAGYLLAYPQYAATLPLLIAAYVLLGYPLVTRSLLPALRALPPQVLEAARTLGAPSAGAHRYVTLPLILPALRGGAALALATVLGEFGATLVLTRPEWATLSVGLYERLGRPGERNLGEACALATVLMLLAMFSFTLLDGSEGEVT